MKKIMILMVLFSIFIGCKEKSEIIQELKPDWQYKFGENSERAKSGTWIDMANIRYLNKKTVFLSTRNNVDYSSAYSEGLCNYENKEIKEKTMGKNGVGIRCFKNAKYLVGKFEVHCNKDEICELGWTHYDEAENIINEENHRICTKKFVYPQVYEWACKQLDNL